MAFVVQRHKERSLVRQSHLQFSSTIHHGAFVSWWFQSFVNPAAAMPNTEGAMTKPETRTSVATGDLRHSLFGLAWSLVIPFAAGT